jgi:hypothetical protein
MLKAAEWQAVARELLLFVKQAAAPKQDTIGQVARVIEGLSTDERRALLNICRRRAGLGSPKQVEDQVRYEAA